MKRRNLRFLERAQKSPAFMEDCKASCKFLPVRSHVSGASIQPAGLSRARTARSSYMIGMTIPASLNSICCGFGTIVCWYARELSVVQRMILQPGRFGPNALIAHKTHTLAASLGKQERMCMGKVLNPGFDVTS